MGLRDGFGMSAAPVKGAEGGGAENRNRVVTKYEAKWNLVGRPKVAHVSDVKDKALYHIWRKPQSGLREKRQDSVPEWKETL